MHLLSTAKGWAVRQRLRAQGPRRRAEDAGREAHGVFIGIHTAEDLAKFDATPGGVLSAFPAPAFDCHAMEEPAMNPAAGVRPLSACTGIVGSGRRFYFLAVWK